MAANKDLKPRVYKRSKDGKFARVAGALAGTTSRRGSGNARTPAPPLASARTARVAAPRGNGVAALTRAGVGLSSEARKLVRGLKPGQSVTLPNGRTVSRKGNGFQISRPKLTGSMRRRSSKAGKALTGSSTRRR